MVGVEGWRLFGGGTAPAGVGLPMNCTGAPIRQPSAKLSPRMVSLRQRSLNVTLSLLPVPILIMFLVLAGRLKDVTRNAF